MYWRHTKAGFSPMFAFSTPYTLAMCCSAAFGWVPMLLQPHNQRKCSLNIHVHIAIRHMYSISNCMNSSSYHPCNETQVVAEHTRTTKQNDINCMFSRNGLCENFKHPSNGTVNPTHNLYGPWLACAWAQYGSGPTCARAQYGPGPIGQSLTSALLFA
jgi:hypothetical protein